MLSLFRTNQFLASILFLPYLLLLRLSVFFFPQPEVSIEGSGLAFRWILGLTGTSGWLLQGVTLLLLFITATWLTAFVLSSRVGREVTLFPGVFFLLICSLFPENLALSPLHFANLFLLASLSQLQQTYKRLPAAGYLFNAGFWIGIASLFVPAYAVFLLFAYPGLNLLRAFKLREWIMVFLGFLTPYWLVFAVLFWVDQPDLLSRHFQQGFALLDPTGHAVPPWIPKLLIIASLLIVVLFSYGQYLFKTSIRVQKAIQLLFWLLFAAGLAALVQARLGISHVQLLALPLGSLLALNFIRLTASWAELLHLLFLLAVAFFQLANPMAWL